MKDMHDRIADLEQRVAVLEADLPSRPPEAAKNPAGPVKAEEREWPAVSFHRHDEDPPPGSSGPSKKDEKKVDTRKADAVKK